MPAAPAEPRAGAATPSEVGGAGEGRDRGELGPGQADDAGRQASQHQPLPRQRQQHQQQEEEAEGGRVGVGEDEVEGGAGEADRRHDRRGDERGERWQQPAGERVEGGEDRRRLQQAEGEGGGEAGAEDGEGTAKRVDAGRAVEVADVAVGLGAGGDRRRRRSARGRRRPMGTPQLAPAERREQGEDDGQAGDRRGHRRWPRPGAARGQALERRRGLRRRRRCGRRRSCRRRAHRADQQPHLSAARAARSASRRGRVPMPSVSKRGGDAAPTAAPTRRRRRSRRLQTKAKRRPSRPSSRSDLGAAAPGADDQQD